MAEAKISSSAARELRWLHFEIHLLVLRHQLGKTLKGLKPLVAGFLDISGTLHFAGTGQYFGKIIGSLADYLVGLVGSRVKAGILHRAAF